MDRQEQPGGLRGAEKCRSNGLGSDCFALVWMEKEKKLYGLNASGAAPAALSAERVRALGFSEMPKAGWIPTLVPGAPAGWAELSRRFGTKPLPELFAPAIRSAREGVPVAVNLEPMWEEDSQRIGRAMAENPAPHAYWWEKFTKNGEPYRAGDIFRWEEYGRGTSSAGRSTPRPWRSWRPQTARATTGAPSWRKLWPSAGRPGATSQRRTFIPTAPCGWSPSRWTTRGTPSVRFPPTATASPSSWP